MADNKLLSDHDKIISRIHFLCLLCIEGSLSFQYVIGFVEAYCISYPDSDISVFYHTYPLFSETRFVSDLEAHISGFLEL